MRNSLLYSLFILLLILVPVSFAEESCDISSTSDSPIEDYKENIETLQSSLRTLANTSQCSTDSSSSSSSMSQYISKLVPLSSMEGLIREISSLSSNGADFYSEVDLFLDQAGPILELKEHRNAIEKIERGILETAQYVGLRCAQGIKVTENILGDDIGYDTRSRTIQEVLADMTKQTKQVKRFFQILGQGIQTEEYIDEAPFPIATPGFSKDMYVYYSPKKLQACRDNDPRKKAITEVIKSAFTVGWKYPQAIQIWKEAVELLLYRSSQLTGTAVSDSKKDTEIENIVKAKLGGTGNSDIIINKQFLKEFGYRPNTKSVVEIMDTRLKRSFYETTGYDFRRKVIPSLINQDTSAIKAGQTKTETNQINRLQTVEKNLYSTYGPRKDSIADHKQQDPKLAGDLINILMKSDERLKTIKKVHKTMCTILAKQAGNVSESIRCPIDA